MLGFIDDSNALNNGNPYLLSHVSILVPLGIILLTCLLFVCFYECVLLLCQRHSSSSSSSPPSSSAGMTADTSTTSPHVTGEEPSNPFHMDLPNDRPPSYYAFPSAPSCVGLVSPVSGEDAQQGQPNVIIPVMDPELLRRIIVLYQIDGTEHYRLLEKYDWLPTEPGQLYGANPPPFLANADLSRTQQQQQQPHRHRRQQQRSQQQQQQQLPSAPYSELNPAPMPQMISPASDEMTLYQRYHSPPSYEAQ